MDLWRSRDGQPAMSRETLSQMRECHPWERKMAQLEVSTEPQMQGALSIKPRSFYLRVSTGRRGHQGGSRPRLVVGHLSSALFLFHLFQPVANGGGGGGGGGRLGNEKKVYRLLKLRSLLQVLRRSIPLAWLLACSLAWWNLYLTVQDVLHSGGEASPSGDLPFSYPRQLKLGSRCCNWLQAATLEKARSHSLVHDARLCVFTVGGRTSL